MIIFLSCLPIFFFWLNIFQQTALITQKQSQFQTDLHREKKNHKTNQ